MGRLDQPQFTKTRRLKVAEIRVRTPHIVGVKEVAGLLWYISATRGVSVYLSSVNEQGNLGPAIEEQTYQEWPAGGSDFAGMRRHLEAKVAEFRKKISAREIPERAFLLSRCNNTGQADKEFMLATCINCQCWYCEISGG